MAMIMSIQLDNQGILRNNISETSGTYKVGYVNGEKVIAISTTGSKTRKFLDKSSQTIHINRNIAKEIIEILNSEFNL